jgi:hypothetical protein
MVALLSAHTESSVKSVSLESIDEVLRQLGPGPTRQSTVETIRQAVLRDIDMNINRKSEEMWKKGRVMIQEMEQKQRQMTAQFAEGVTKVQEKQRALEAENAWLKHTLIDLNDKFSNLGAVLASDSVPSCAATPPRSHSPPEIHRCGKLPDVPAFPFPLPPTPVPTAAPPLSLVSALGVPPPPEALVRQKTPLSLMETLAPPSAFPLTPAHSTTDGGSFGYPEGIETPSSDSQTSPLAWGHAQADQVGRAQRDSQTEEEWDEQQLLDLAMLHGGCASVHALPDYSLLGGVWPGFAMRADASVFVPSVSVGAA